jgi:hypothetical protein
VPALSDGSNIDAAQSAALRNHDPRRLARVWEGLGPGSQDAKGNGPLHLACQPTPQAAASLEFLREVLSWARRVPLGFLASYLFSRPEVPPQEFREIPVTLIHTPRRTAGRRPR